MSSTLISALAARTRVLVGIITIFGLLVGSAASGFAEAKAYEVVKYKGKAGGLTFALDYGDGYAHASHLKVTEAGKTTQFMLDESGEMHFVPKDKRGGDKKVILKMAMDEGAPDKIEGTYVSGGKTTGFTLHRK
ncbi:MAG TPA: hypothetical protein VM940_02250 [Chthoniobacterales bacterium]|jgi:hypothetical protein|nr:hypothetical protein [Chthoniobacterales bacterium]